MSRLSASSSAAALAVALLLSVAPGASMADETRHAPPGGNSGIERSFQVAQLFGGNKRTREAAELNLRVDGVEQEIRNLTGKIEELSFQLRQLQDQMRRMQEDNEFRFQQLESGDQKRGDVNPPTPSDTDLAANSSRAYQTGDPQKHVLGTLPGSYAEDGSNTQSGGADQGGASGGPLDLSALARGNSNDPVAPPASQEPGPAAAPVSGEPNQDYEAAYTHVLQGDYTTSERMFRDFLTAYPDHQLAGNAQYWLGESLFARGLYREAADAFLKSYSEYPGSTKGPDSLLKLGLALAGLGEQAAACATYGELLAKFPEAPASVKNRAAVESRVIGCAS